MTDFEFVLGFAELARAIPHIVGRPLENEHFSPESGDSLQKTTRGLMVWRKADNWCAFTDGERTWINGPEGLQERGNEERFDWERAPERILTLPSPIIERWDSPNCWRGRPYGDPIALVLHTMAGSEAGAESWLNSLESATSAHFGVNLDPGDDVDQFVALSDRAWANGVIEEGSRWFDIYRGPRDGFRENPNHHTVSIETEDLGSTSTPVSNAQFERTMYVGVMAKAHYPSIRYLLGHHVISPRSRPNCPGARWIASGRFETLARELGLVPVF